MRAWAISPTFQALLDRAAVELPSPHTVGEGDRAEIGGGRLAAGASEPTHLEPFDVAAASASASVATEPPRAADKVLDVSNLIELSPSERVSLAIDAALELGEANGMVEPAIPSHSQLVAELKTNWNADILLRETAAQPSDVSSAWDLPLRAAAGAGGEGLSDSGRRGPGEPILRVALSHPLVDQELLVLGSTTLESLRWELFCIHDHVRGGPERAENYCFFFNDTFYCSTSNADRSSDRYVNLAQPISVWASRLGRGFLQQVSVSGVTFGNLGLQIGKEYLFLHQGDCEHRLRVVGVHLAGEYDSREPSLYPMLVFGSRQRMVSCAACAKALARYQCFDDGYSEHWPLKLCDDCFRAAFYDAQGSLLPRFGGMKAFPYFGENV